ncbi:MAG: RNA-splicing ligase RtcB [Verrucomicrobia bacterium]|jgi:tRNA-splicing ligase RtcB (3'-phosphate/5'-hydroxy nucleic acid ligase)|nr:MAG: RNA-splicing ligase RtcB [Verrucomicrobiota bacterium]
MEARIKIFGEHDGATIRQIETCVAAGGERGVLCADGHKGYAQPIGGVVAYKDKISLSGVGFDIACGNLAILTDARREQIARKIDKIMDDIVRDISFGIGRKSKTRVEHELFDDPAWQLRPIRDLKETARDQLGTVGGGNHYVDLFADEQDRIWVGVHFGSRGLGHKTATHFLKLAGGREGMDVPPTVLDDDSEIGHDYLAGMHLAGRYAYAGREAVARHVAGAILGARILEEVHNHHNFAWREKHDGEEYWVVRKGATPAFPGQRGFVGGSMGDEAVIIEGVDSPTSREALFSTIHGAGRIMSRTAAKGRFEKVGKKRIRREGLVRHDEMMKWIADKGVVLRGGDLDEAPQAYRRLPDVLAAHTGTIRVLHTLRPLGVAMAGRDIVDPYKD